MALTEIFGYAGALLTLVTFSMRTMLQLRKLAICANLAFIVYGAIVHVYPVLLLHVILLPLNVWRLRQLLQLTDQIRNASNGKVGLEWLKPYTQSRSIRAGQVLFRKGERADHILFILAGQFRAVEADVVLGPGEVFGEIGLVTKGNSRTQTVVCESAGALLTIRYDEVRQMYYQNPRFGLFFLELVAERLMRDANQLRRNAEPQEQPAEH